MTYKPGDKNSMQFKLKYERRRRGISQTALANKMGISQSHLSYIESCRRDLTMKRYEQIISIFDDYDKHAAND